MSLSPREDLRPRGMGWLTQSGWEPWRVAHEILDFDASSNPLSVYYGVFWGERGRESGVLTPQRGRILHLLASPLVPGKALEFILQS